MAPPTEKQIEQLVPTSEINTSGLGADSGGGMNLAPSPDYSWEAQWYNEEEEYQATLGAQEERAGKDISFGQAPSPITAAPPAVTADVAEADQPWFTESGSFAEGRRGGKWPFGEEAGEPWTEESFNEVYSDFKDNFWGGIGGREGEAIEGNIQLAIEDMEKFGSVRNQNAMSAIQKGIKNFYNYRLGGEADNLTDAQKKELLYREVKGLVGDDFDIDSFMKQIDPNMTDDDLKLFKGTTTRMEDAALGKKEQTAGVLSESVAQMGSNVRDTLANMGQGT